jgi:hypothetical protein
MQKTEFLVIALTTAAIIAAVTTVSISAATPAFAKLNCTDTPTSTTCSGGSSLKASLGIPGGMGLHTRIDVTTSEQSTSGGAGLNTGTVVGGAGDHRTCDLSGCPPFVGGAGAHDKGPGGNSDNVPPP